MQAYFKLYILTSIQETHADITLTYYLGHQHERNENVNQIWYAHSHARTDLMQL